MLCRSGLMAIDQRWLLLLVSWIIADFQQGEGERDREKGDRGRVLKSYTEREKGVGQKVLLCHPSHEGSN